MTRRRARSVADLIATWGLAVAVLGLGLECARELRAVLVEHRDHVRAEAQRIFDLEVETCQLRHGRWERGDCRWGSSGR